MSDDEQITVGSIATPEGSEPGASVDLPVVEVLTGRGFVTGKSGSGKSNTASVVIEELLDCGYPVMIVDTDGEYYGLKEEYELLHAGADEECDIQVSPEHAEKLATLALEENVPIILDVSGYLDEGDADELLRETARHLFAKEKKLKKPFLLVVEEVHEYLPQKGGGGEVGNLLIKIGKRGRKHGLGLLGISQRPADVKKDFITQANWLLWHRLTWDNDTKVVGRVVDSEYAERVADLGDGEAFVQTDWTDADVRRVQFRRQRTFDAGATPGLDDFERPDLKSVSDSLMDDLADITDEQEQRESELADLRQQLDTKRAEINQLEQELEKARDISDAARQLANAFRRNDIAGNVDAAELEATIDDQADRIEQLEGTVDERTARIAELEEALEARDERIDDLDEELADAYDRVDRLEAENDRLREEVIDARQSRLSELGRRLDQDEATTQQEPAAADGATDAGIVDADTDEFGLAEQDDTALIDADAVQAADASEDDTPANEKQETTGGLGGLDSMGISSTHDDSDSDDAEVIAAENDGVPEDLERRPVDELVRTEPILSKVEAAVRESQCNPEHSWLVIDILAGDGPKRPDELEGRVDARVQHIWTLLAELRSYEFVERNHDARYELDPAAMRSVIVEEHAVNEQFQEFKEHAQQVD